MRDHLLGLDSGSGEGRLIAWAVNEIEHLMHDNERLLESLNSKFRMDDKPHTTSFVLMLQPYEGQADVIYVGTDKAKALDALLEWGKQHYAEVGNLKIVDETP